MSPGCDMGQIGQYPVTEHDAGVRLDVFVAAHADDLSRSAAQRLIRGENVLLNGEGAKPSTPVTPGAVVQVTVPPPESLDVLAEAIPLRIAYEDDDLIVADKSSGMVVHPAPGNWSGTLVNALLGH